MSNQHYITIGNKRYNTGEVYQKVMISTTSIGVCPHRGHEVFEVRRFSKQDNHYDPDAWYPISDDFGEFFDWDEARKYHLEWVRGLGDNFKITEDNCGSQETNP